MSTLVGQEGIDRHLRLAGKLVRRARRWVLPIKADPQKWRFLQAARICGATLRTSKEKANRIGRREVSAAGGQSPRDDPWTREL